MTEVFFLFVYFVLAGTVKSTIADDRLAYLKWMKQSLPDVPEWTAWQQKSGELPPEFDKLPRSNLLPDPLRFMDGRPVKDNSEDWASRRDEIRRLFEKYMTGTFPPKPPIDQAANGWGIEQA